MPTVRQRFPTARRAPKRAVVARLPVSGGTAFVLECRHSDVYSAEPILLDGGTTLPCLACMYATAPSAAEQARYEIATVTEVR